MRKLPYQYSILLLVVFAWCGISYFGLLDFIEEQTIDWRFQARGELPSQTKIFYLDVDAKSIADVGNLAWDRAYYVDVCEAVLKQGGASVIGIDYVFSDRGMPEIADGKRFREGTFRMAQFLFSESPPNVVLAAGYASAQDRDINGLPIVRALPRVSDAERQTHSPELPQFRVENRIYTPPHVGLIDTIDGTMNVVPLFAPEGGKMWFNMSVELTRLAWKLPPEGVRVFPDKLVFMRGDGVPLASVPLIDGQDVEVNWSTHWISRQNPRASFSEALAASHMLKSALAEDRAAAETFFARMKDAIVLIGPVDPLLQDRAPTRLDSLPVPRVGVMGNLIRMFHSGQYVKRPPLFVQWLIIFGLTATVCGLQMVRRARFWFWLLAKIAAAAIVVLYVYVVFVVFSQTNLILPLVTPLGAAVSTSFALTGMLLLAAERMRYRITNLFGTYVSPALVERMIESGEEPQLGGMEVQITAYFSDVQNFTMMAESLPPARLVELMNDYLSTCTDVITAQDGTLDKYVGDAVVAMFGAPVACVDHAYRACVASQIVHARVLEFRERWPDISHLPMRAQIGLSTGKAVVGNIGSRTRFNYTMMGDTVNVAARLESAARFFGVQTVVSEETRAAAVKYGDRCVFRYLGKIQVKGRQHPVDIHEIMGLRDQLPAAALECRRVFVAGLEKYIARDWTGAVALFEQSARLEWYPVKLPDQQTPSEIYLERARALAANPPEERENWDGVFVMATK